MEKELYVDYKDWESVSSNAKDFLRKVLTKDPKERLTCEEALSHPWLDSQSNSSIISTKLDHVSGNLVKFYQASSFQKMVLSILASLKV